MWSTWLRGKACNKSNKQVSGYGNMGHNVLICFQSEFLWQLLLCHESWRDFCPGFQQLYMLVTASLLTKPLKTLSKIESSNPCHCSGPSATHASSQTFPRKTPPSTGSQSTCKVLPLAVAIGGSSWNSREACLPADFRLPLLSIERWWMKNPIWCFAVKDLFADENHAVGSCPSSSTGFCYDIPHICVPWPLCASKNIQAKGGSNLWNVKCYKLQVRLCYIVMLLA